MTKWIEDNVGIEIEDRSGGWGWEFPQRCLEYISNG